MPQTATINPRIIEGLYCEALVLSDEVRAAFDLSRRLDDHSETVGGDENIARVALSCEALRTTTRMMHAIAWLLNHRAYLAGEISEFQLRRHGRLAPDYPTAEPDRMALLAPDIRKLITTTEKFYARLLRVDHGWRTQNSTMPSAIERLRHRLSEQVNRVIGA